eukprot:6967843-Ditylum_brightwellii.AAC.1
MTEAAVSMRLGLNKTQTTTFFTSSKQMKVTKETLEKLGKEEIKEVKDLAEFNKETWKQVADNLKYLGGWMKNSDNRADKNHAKVPQTPYPFGAKMRKKLLEVSKLMRYYETIGCHVTVLNTVYKTVI